MHVALLRGCNPRSSRATRPRCTFYACFARCGATRHWTLDTGGYKTVTGLAVLQFAIDWRAMTDPNEIRALKASLRGALDTAAALAALQAKVEALDEYGDIGTEDLEELSRVTSGHAVASTALRGFVGTMRTRRSGATS
jgi:hypothetical protein